MTMSWSPSHLLVWPNSRSKAFPVGGITLPSGRVILPVKVPVTLVSESEVAEVDRDHQEIADGFQVRRAQVGTTPRRKSDPIDGDDVSDILRSGDSALSSPTPSRYDHRRFSSAVTNVLPGARRGSAFVGCLLRRPSNRGFEFELAEGQNHIFSTYFPDVVHTARVILGEEEPFFD